MRATVRRVDADDAPGTATAAPGAPASVRSGPVAWVRSWSPQLQDALLAAAVFTVQLIGLFAIDEDIIGPGATRGLDVFAVLLVAGATAPLLARRRYPIVALAVAVAAFITFFALDYDAGFLGYSLLVAIYSVVVYRGLRTGVIAAALAFGGVVVAYALTNVATSPAARLIDLFLIAVGVAAGDATRNRMARQRAEAERLVQLEAERRLEAEVAVTEERTRIARELHDLVAHSMSVVAVQAGMGHHVIDHDPATAKEALANIERTSRDALAEMRRMLGILRTRSDDPQGTAPELVPQPGLEQLATLVERARSSGLDVRLTVPDPLPPVDGGVALAAHRIVQEGLTNVIKHAGPATVDVRLGVSGEALEVVVEDDGHGAATRRDRATPGAGMGLIGMRERAELLGGHVDAGPRTGGGFRVSARLPLRQRTDGGGADR